MSTNHTVVANSQYHPGTQIIRSQGNAFDVAPRSSNPDSHRPPAKRGPRSGGERAAIALMTDAERIADRTAKVLIDNSKRTYVIGNRTDDTAKTARIVGKSAPNWKDA